MDLIKVYIILSTLYVCVICKQCTKFKCEQNDRNVRFGYFSGYAIEDRFLNDPNQKKINVTKEQDCVKNCVRIGTCRTISVVLINKKNITCCISQSNIYQSKVVVKKGSKIISLGTPACQSSPCQNGGICQPDYIHGNYSCNCTQLDIWTGKYCEIKDLCLNSPCKNGGACTHDHSKGNYSCNCTQAWFGHNCEFYDFCLNSPCQNGKCHLDQINKNYNCDCIQDWSGKNCSSYMKSISIVISFNVNNTLPTINVDNYIEFYPIKKEGVIVSSLYSDTLVYRLYPTQELVYGIKNMDFLANPFVMNKLTIGCWVMQYHEKDGEGVVSFKLFRTKNFLLVVQGTGMRIQVKTDKVRAYRWTYKAGFLKSKWYHLGFRVLPNKMYIGVNGKFLVWLPTSCPSCSKNVAPDIKFFSKDGKNEGYTIFMDEIKIFDHAKSGAALSKWYNSEKGNYRSGV